MFTYKNRNTGDVYTFPERHAELDALANWELIEGAEVPEVSRRAAELADAERRCIEEAQQHRFDGTLAANAGAANRMAARSESREGGSPNVTAAHAATAAAAPAGVQVGVLSNPELKIGGLHGGPVNRDEVARIAEEQAKNPPQGGVLARAKRDQREGNTQIGDNPEEHRQVLAGLRPNRADAGAEPKGKSGRTTGSTAGDDAGAAGTGGGDDTVEGASGDGTPSVEEAGEKAKRRRAPSKAAKAAAGKSGDDKA